jgi:hypothetical protein
MKHRKSVAAPLAVGSVAAAVLTITSFGTYAALTSQVSNELPQQVSTGTLILDLADTGAGFGQTISNLAPGDTVNRYVELTNSGTLEGQSLTVAITPSVDSDSVLMSDGPGDTTKALTLTVSSCPVAWDAGDFSCTGGATELQSASSLGALTSPISLGTGSVGPDASFYLKISLSLPDQDEVTVNGVPPTPTIQNAAANLTYTFAIAQRGGTTTNE